MMLHFFATIISCSCVLNYRDITSTGYPPLFHNPQTSNMGKGGMVHNDMNGMVHHDTTNKKVRLVIIVS